MGSMVGGIIIGWKGEQILTKGKELGFEFDINNDDSFYLDSMVVNQELLELQRTILRDVFQFSIIEEKETPYNYDIYIDTQKGKKRTTNMSYRIYGTYYDPEDIHNLVFGIEIAGSFDKVLMDWDRTNNGGSDFSFSLTPEKMQQFQKIKEKIVEKYPVFHDAEIRFELSYV